MKEKKTALKKAEKEVASLEAKKAKADAKAAEEAVGERHECGRDSGKTEINKNPRKNKSRLWKRSLLFLCSEIGTFSAVKYN